jgi:peptidoglycan/xylan/chitin deacetylase (PgdA/CDA1 family)
MSVDSPTRTRISLTFDNGPTAGVTDQVLDLLAERSLPATFFVVGRQLCQPGGRDLARRALAEGHRIGHHSATHTVLLGAAADADEAVRAEIAEMAPWLEEFDGEEKLYRPYAAGGVLDRTVFSSAALRYLQDHGYTCVLWNSVPHDWDDPGGWVATALTDVDGQDWTVVVLHDLDTGAMRLLPRFLDELADRHVDVTGDFPESCLPIRAGRMLRPLAHLTN